MKLLSSAATAQVRATGFRIITARYGTDELMVELHPLLRGLLNEGAVDFNIHRRDNRIYIEVREWADDQ